MPMTHVRAKDAVLAAGVLAAAVFAGVPAFARPPARQPLPGARVVDTVDDDRRVRLAGNVHPLAHPRADRGAIEDGRELRRMLLLLKRSPEQQRDLDQLLADQLT